MGHYDTTDCDICGDDALEHYWDNYNFCSGCKRQYYGITNESLCGIELSKDEFKSIIILLKLNS